MGKSLTSKKKGKTPTGIHHKTRKMRITTKVIIPAAFVIVAVCAIMAFMFKARMETDMIATGAQVAKYVGTKAVDKMDGNLLDKLNVGGEGTGAYLALAKSLTETVEGSPIKYIYTLYTDGEKVYYGVDVDADVGFKKGDKPVNHLIGDEYEKSYSDIKAVFEGKTIAEKVIRYNKSQALITAYVPVYDRKMTLVGAVGCDYNAASIVSAVNTTMRNVVIIAVICAFVAILLFQVIISRIVRNLWNVDDRIYDIVNSNGDLTKTVDIRTGDEIECIANHVNELLAHMREIMANISDNSRKLSGSSESVVTHLKSTQENVSEVSATMQEMNATMEETTASINRINDSVNEVYDFIEEINKRAQAGGELSNDIKESAQRLQGKALAEQQSAKEHAGQIAQSLNARIEESKAVEQIAELTTNIINITDQTNLLSLNASIEAARAGEAGRGFAVVADEIGKLATDSASAAEQIQEVSDDVIKAVNALAEEATRMIDFMEKTAMNGYSELVKASEEYNEDARQIDDMMQVFSDQSSQLRANMDSICQVMEAVNSSMEESANGVTRISQMSVNITDNVVDIEGQADANKDIANQLDMEVNKFRLH